MSDKLIERIKHYQKDIEKCPDNSERMMKCIKKLYTLPVKVEHLHETGVGRSVNSLRKYKGEVGDAAKSLVAKWKAMVAAEESSDESHELPSSKPQQVKITPPPSVPPPQSKIEQKQDRPKDTSKEKQNNKEHKSNNYKQQSESKTNHKDNKSHHISKSSESKSHSSSSKRSHSSSSSSNHVSDKRDSSSNHVSDKRDSSSNHVSEKRDSSSKNHKENSDKKHKSELDHKPPPNKKHKHSHSHSKSSSSSSKKSRQVSVSEEDSSDNEESDRNEASDQGSASQDESEAESDRSKSEESDSSSSSDNRHRSKHKSHHKHKHSSHSKDRGVEKKKKHEDSKHKSRDKDKNKENHSHNKSSKHCSKKRSSSPDYQELIKENEQIIKKEEDEFLLPSVPKYTPTPKPVKIERNEDGSIDSGSGASFADALLGMDYGNQKKKKKSSSSGSSSSSPTKLSKSKTPLPVIKVEGQSSSKSSSSSKSRSINELVEETPELLTKKVKLEELDLDISSTLPEINPNYRPLPHIPERTRPVKTMSDEDTMFSLMTTKNQRTKVFSGNKVYQNSVPTLFSLCIQLLYDNIDAVEYTGGVPFNLLKPLLEKLNADQLYVLEHFNPYLIEDTDDLWKFHCNKDFRSEKRQDMESWRDLYLRCLDERERKLKALTANISQSMAKSTPVRQAKLAYVDTAVKPPRNVLRKQAKYGTGNGAGTTIVKNPTKEEIVSKAIVGGNTPGVSAKDVVPTPPPIARAAAHHPSPAIMKKKKAPLMQKALQVMKGTRYKR